MSELVPVNRREIIASTLASLRQQGLLEYGSFIPREKIIELVGEFANEESLWSFVIEISNQLMEEGKGLESRHLNGTGWRIPQAIENYHIANRWFDQISRNYRKSICLLANTDRSSFNEAEKLRDANCQRQLEHQYLMHRRRSQVLGLVQKHRPALLQKNRVIETD